jgi:hypothetical protein
MNTFFFIYQIKEDYDDEMLQQQIDNELTHHHHQNHLHHQLNEINGHIEYLTERELLDLQSLSCSPTVFSTKLLLKLFTKEELIGHNLSTKPSITTSSTMTRSSKNNNNNIINNSYHTTKPLLDENRIQYIKNMVEKYWILSQPNTRKNIEEMWQSCRKAINRVIRNFEIKESKLIKAIEADSTIVVNTNSNVDPVDSVDLNSDFLPSSKQLTSYKIMILDNHHHIAELGGDGSMQQTSTGHL